MSNARLQKDGNAYLTIEAGRDSALHVEPGEQFTVETYDYVGDILDEDTQLRDVLGTDRFDDNINPVTGPITVEGASPGDALAVEIVDVSLPERGVINVLPGFGGLEASTYALAEASEPDTRFPRIDDGRVSFPLDDGRTIDLPVRPQIGTIGTAERYESRYSVKPSDHGGNMDCPEIGPGTTLTLPVDVDGGHLYLGDCHAAQGDGEICGISVEVPAEVTLEVDVVPDGAPDWPRIETEDRFGYIACARPAERAMQLAYRELIREVAASWELTETEAYELCSAAGRARFAQIVNPEFTVAATIRKAYCPSE